MSTMGTQAELQTQLGCRKDRSAPTLEALPQQRTELAMHVVRVSAVREALAVGWIGAQEPGAVRSGRPRFGQCSALEMHECCDPGARCVGACLFDRALILVAAKEPYGAGIARARSAVRLGAQPGPQRGIVSAPVEKTEILARQSRCMVGGDERRLDTQCSRATERIEKLRRRFARAPGADARQLLPAGAQHYPRRDVLLQRRLAGRCAITTAVQALAREIDGQRDLRTLGVGMHAHVRPRACHVRTGAGGRAQRIDDAVLELQRTELGMRDRWMAPAEIAGERGTGSELRGPVEGGDRGVKFARIVRLEARELQVHTVRGARPQAGAVRALERAREGHLQRALAHVLRAAAGELAREEIRAAARRAGEKVELGSAHARERGRCLPGFTPPTGRSTWSSARCTSRAREGTCRGRYRTA